MAVEPQLLPYRALASLEAEALVRRLDRIKEEIYRDETLDVNALFQKHLLQSEYEHFMEYTREQKIDLTHHDQAQDFVTKVLDSLTRYEMVILRLAFQPRYEFMNMILDWFGNNTTNFLRVQIVYDKNIIGGLVAEWSGRVYDLSLSKDLESKQQAILTLT